MDLQLDDQQKLLAQSLERFLEKRLPFESRVKQRGEGSFLAFWKQMTDELGFAGAGLDEDVEGFGGGAEAEMIVAGALGKALAVTPYVDSLVLSASLLFDLGEYDLVRLIAGQDALVVTAIEEEQTRGNIEHIQCVAQQAGSGWKLNGKKLAVNFAGDADIILIPARLPSGELALFSVRQEEIGGAIKPFRLIDDTPSADLILDDLEISASALLARGSMVSSALQKAVNRALAALCAEGAAAAQVMLDDTVSYARDRKQFGVPIGSFQALQHRMVDMFLKVEELSAASLLATLKVDDDAAVSAAKAILSEGLRLVGQEAIQLHGAMGLTEELRVGHYFKRAMVLENRLGNTDYHVSRYQQSS
ncbi:acyl-CoA dehydrogenase [Parasphingorhabdus sp.]|uniref:acyl-CoA dehydrogenase family protein n=1 Tax=Parasphingorhabdus sp. TaxID=2709688 RepID=UPI002F926390